MKQTLAHRITLEVAFILFGGLLIKATFQHFTTASEQGEPLFNVQLLNLVFTSLIYAVLVWRLRTLVLGPLNRVFIHSGELSCGTFRGLKYPKTDTELDRVAGLMNRTANHLLFLHETDWKRYADTLDLHLELSREISELPSVASEKSGEIRDSLRQLHQSIVSFSESPDELLETGVTPVHRTEALGDN